MSVQTDQLPPAPEHTPPLKEDEIIRAHGKFFNQVWTRWFVSLRDKVNVLNESLVNLAGLIGTGILIKNGSAWVLRSIIGTSNRIDVTNGSGAAGNPTINVITANLVAGTGISFIGSGDDRIINNGVGNLTINLSTTLADGTYTPTVIAIANVTASTSFLCTWTRIGNSVLISGRIDITPTVAATFTQVRFTIPIASNFTAGGDASGTGTWNTSITALGSSFLTADAVNDQLTLSFLSVSTTNHGNRFVVMYPVLL